ncbi:MAG: cell division protein FtsA [Alphaproteobacteria bacterium]|jgi:cell division protein FtsA|nr:cell division protein FtsA [Alphaproteobacteria bacterium]
MSAFEQRAGGRLARADGEPFAALDVGGSKIACMIARRDSRKPGGFVIAGTGRQQSRGFANGAITDIDALERTVRLVVEDAEREADQRISRVCLGLTGMRMSSQLVSGGCTTGGREVSLRDVRRAHAACLAKAQTKGREILGVWPVAYRVDDQEGVREPVGMLAARIGALVNVVSAPQSVVRNLTECISRAYLKIEQVVPSSIASGLGALVEDERDNGSVCIDMGAGATTICVMMNGAPAWLSLVPAGGAHVTGDLAQGLGTTFAAAERLKTVHGQADREAPGLSERIEMPRLGDDGRLNAVRMPRRKLVEIVEPRIEEVFEIVRDQLAASPVARVMPRRVVLTGGASQLPGVRELATRVLGVPVRLGNPVLAENLGETLSTPAFSSAAGLLTLSMAGSPGAVGAGLASGPNAGVASESGGMVNRTLRWLRENF